VCVAWRVWTLSTTSKNFAVCFHVFTFRGRLLCPTVRCNDASHFLNHSTLIFCLWYIFTAQYANANKQVKHDTARVVLRPTRLVWTLTCISKPEKDNVLFKCLTLFSAPASACAFQQQGTISRKCVNKQTPRKSECCAFKDTLATFVDVCQAMDMRRDLQTQSTLLARATNGKPLTCAF